MQQDNKETKVQGMPESAAIPKSPKPASKPTRAKAGQGKQTRASKPKAGQGKAQKQGQPVATIEVDSSELLNALEEAMGQPEAGPEETQPEAEATKQAKAEAAKIHKALLFVRAQHDKASTMQVNLAHVCTGTQAKAKARLTEETQQACNIAKLDELLNAGKTALNQAQQALDQAISAQSSTEANEARKQAKLAVSDISQAYKEAGKIARAADRAIAKQEKQAKAAAAKAQKQQEKTDQLLTEAQALKQALDQEIAMLSGQGQHQGNRIIDVELNQAHADVLNLIADGLWAEMTKAGISIIPAQVNLSTARLKALMNQVIDMGYAAESGDGYILTDSGLALFETNLEEVKANFAQMLQQAS